MNKQRIKELISKIIEDEDCTVLIANRLAEIENELEDNSIPIVPVKLEIAEEKIKELFSKYTYTQYCNPDKELVYRKDETPIYITNYESIKNLIKEVCKKFSV